MKHYKWSLISGMLLDLPGVEYETVRVSTKGKPIENIANLISPTLFQMFFSFVRHDTKYLEYDEMIILYMVIGIYCHLLLNL